MDAVAETTSSDYTAPEDTNESDDVDAVAESAAEDGSTRRWACEPTDGQAKRLRIVKEEGDGYVWVSGLVPPPGFSRFDRLLSRDLLFRSRQEAERHCGGAGESSGH